MLHEEWARGALDELEGRGRLRALRTFDASGPTGTLDGRRVVSFASNDYLGLSNHPDVAAAAHAAIDRWGTGATASRLVVGNRPCHDRLEMELARWKGTESAVLFPNGFAANLGVMTALGGPDCLVVSDELNHASIIDGCRLSRSPVEVVGHNDVERVESVVASASTPRVMVVVDTVFSMDGDNAPVDALAEICARHGALLVLDDAHAVLGPDTRGLADLEGLERVHVVTMSKSLGSMGGAVCGSRAVVDLLVNRARSLIFSTGLSPADAAAASAALSIATDSEGDRLRERLRSSVDRFAPGHPSPILPIVVGDEGEAVAMSDRLLGRGLLVPAIRPPTVPPGTSRLRVALSAAHDDEMLDDLEAGLDAVRGDRR